MRYPEHVLVVLACTLAGGVEQLALPPHLRPAGSGENHQTCGAGSAWMECSEMDKLVLPVHIYAPWTFTVCFVLVLGMPTVLLRSRHKEQGLRQLAWICLQCLVLAYGSLFATDHPVLIFSLTLHSCVRVLLRMPVTDRLLGGRWWWGLRYAGALALLAGEIALGVPVSIVRWRGDVHNLSCAYLAHLGGCLVPDMLIFLLDWTAQTAACVLLAGADS